MEWASELIKWINKDHSLYKESRRGKHEIKTNVEKTFRQVSGHTGCKIGKKDGEKQTNNNKKQYQHKQWKEAVLFLYIIFCVRCYILYENIQTTIVPYTKLKSAKRYLFKLMMNLSWI